MKHRFPLFFSLAFLSLFLFLFGGPPGFRDGAHFYGPLFEYLRSELVAGRLPLWNPYENLGQPLAANPTTMLFYPGLWIALSLTLLPFCVYFFCGEPLFSGFFVHLSPLSLLGVQP